MPASLMFSHEVFLAALWNTSRMGNQLFLFQVLGASWNAGISQRYYANWVASDGWALFFTKKTFFVWTANPTRPKVQKYPSKVRKSPSGLAPSEWKGSFFYQRPFLCFLWSVRTRPGFSKYSLAKKGFLVRGTLGMAVLLPIFNSIDDLGLNGVVPFWNIFGNTQEEGRARTDFPVFSHISLQELLKLSKLLAWDQYGIKYLAFAYIVHSLCWPLISAHYYRNT